ncbi:RsiW-degrading membrane proteinase PrsW (M82 family) [Planomicrobium koreense]|uniref:Protease PrsW n=1 Tax=Planococcus koreensis TaxID=112331 RepID=A0A7W8CRK9_9BACL|nr:MULTISPECIES: glutamic-type intramembrane protease PrsW [Planococcus]MBB5178700.1 RsiW-degrading membrane proteinase PrsW (M82 family) [Planococcus koreensis]MDN3450426.1 glutamic-type intramembrane protease PrsW [Planococcus sp. APC 3906]
MIILLTVAIAPSLALFSYFYLRDDFAEEPSKLIFQCFIYGAVLTFPILFIQYVFDVEGVFSRVFAQKVFFPSIVEEFFKWLVLIIAVYRHIDFEDPYDGILYGASVSLGFATIENILYLFEFGMQTAFLRAFLPVSSHALFGVVMGFYLGKAKFSTGKSGRKWLGVALLGSLILHLAYNAILYLNTSWSYGVIPFMIFLWWFGLRKVKQAHQLSVSHYHDHTSLHP